MEISKNALTTTSAGLKDLIKNRPGYEHKYELLVQDVKNLAAQPLKAAYPGEYHSWANRKHWAKKHEVAWAPVIEAFVDFLVVLGPIPEEMWTLDRIDPKGQYMPQNLRWASKRVQSQNRTNAIAIDFNGAIRTVSEVALLTGQSYDAVRMGIRRGGNKYLGKLLLKLAGMESKSEEVLWQFPLRYRESLEAEFVKRQGPQQNRLRFFLEVTATEFHRLAFAISIARSEVQNQLQPQADELRCLHNEALDDLKRIQRRARWKHIEAKRWAAFGSLKLPTVAMPEWDEPSLSGATGNDPY